MLDHTGFAVPIALYDETLNFYLKALEPLGYQITIQLPQGVGLGESKADTDFWVIKSDERGLQNENGKGLHYAFRAKSHDEVEAFHKAALALGATTNGDPGFRRYHPFYYSAFVFDPAGNNVEVVCHSKDEAAKKGVSA